MLPEHDFSTFYSLYCIVFLCIYIQIISVFDYFRTLFVHLFDRVYCAVEESLQVSISLYRLHPVSRVRDENFFFKD